MQYIIDYDICAFLIAVITMAYYFICPRLKNNQSGLFAVIGLIIVTVSALDIAAALADGKVPDAITAIINLCYQLCLHTLPCLMVFYILTLTGKLNEIKKRWGYILIIPYLIEALLICTSPLTHLVFYIREGRYTAGPLISILYLIALLYILMSFGSIFVSGRRLKLRRRFAIVILVSFQIAAVAIQYFFPKYLVIDFSAALSLLLMYITMQSSSEISDPLTKAYNYNALSSLISESLNDRKHFIVLGYSLNDVRHINEVYGEAYGDELLIYVAQILNTLGGFTARIYGDEFCVLLERETTVGEIYEEFEKLPRVLNIGKYEIPISASKVILDSSDFTSCSVLLELMDFAFRNNKKYGSGRTIVVDQKLIQKYNRREKVCDAVARAVVERTINVVYQPIVDAYTGKVIAAEALARLNDPELGPIPPDEFITVAEQNGLILDLGRCVREKVWKLLSKYDIREAGINHISVNLSSVECTQKTAMETILEEAEKYGIEPGLIAFEVTETAAVASKEILAFNLNMMRSKGFEFHLDDYGTGYSSMSNLISLPFSVIKFDKSIMKLAMEPQRGDLIKHSIAPMHGYGIKIVIEGIETEEQAEKARSWKVDYFQGFLYSEPLPQNTFLEYACITKKNDTEKQLQTV